MSRRFLIGQLASFGDCLYATAIAKQIKKDYPDSHVTWAVSSKCKSILFLNPHIDNIWEIVDEKKDFFNSTWKGFEKEAEKRKKNGEFDEIIYSQILPKNLYKYNGTIRSSILSAYKRPITVDVNPDVYLTDVEINNVKKFIENNNINTYKHVILFECTPASAQSNKVNMEFAMQIAQAIVENNKDICFILSSHKSVNSAHGQIIDASELSFRENAELTHYCTFLVGCSSGITWLSTSNWANKSLPTLQLLDSNYSFFAGVHYDFEIWHLNSSKIAERLNFDVSLVVQMINVYIHHGFSVLKEQYHQLYRVDYTYCKSVINYGLHSFRPIQTIQFIIRQRNNPHNLETTKIVSIFFKEILIVFIQKMHSVRKKITMLFRKRVK